MGLTPSFLGFLVNFSVLIFHFLNPPTCTARLHRPYHTYTTHINVWAPTSERMLECNSVFNERCCAYLQSFPCASCRCERSVQPPQTWMGMGSGETSDSSLRLSETVANRTRLRLSSRWQHVQSELCLSSLVWEGCFQSGATAKLESFWENLSRMPSAITM